MDERDRPVSAAHRAAETAEHKEQTKSSKPRTKEQGLLFVQLLSSHVATLRYEPIVLVVD